ncbi:hypothetical protein V1264_016767 [Littorina saxatilis]|uniref:Uncharacterized protein n=2 Tax=Littorina saxatilis TaxID=31220 RepID=A0AAN9GDV2_9CAEN
MTKTIGNVQGETWLFVGKLENKDQFNETVEIRPGRMPTPEENTSLVVGLAASAGILVVILCLALVAVCYLQKRRSGAWPLSLNFPISRRPAHRDPNATLPRQPTSPAVEHGDQQDGERQLPSGESQCMFYSDNYEVVKDSLVSL